MFGKKKTDPDMEFRGGCSVHGVQGPDRSTDKAANKDMARHGKRMHGSATFYGGYLETGKRDE